MKSLRVFLYPLLGLFLILFIIGTFTDLSIMKALYRPGEGFSTFMAAFGMIPGCMMMSLAGGAVFANSFKNKDRKWCQILLIVLAVVFTAAGIYFAYGDVFGVNGYNLPKLKYVGIAVVAPFILVGTVLGYFLCRKNENKNLWIPIVVLAVFLVAALLGGLTGIKNIVHRPRYRIVVYQDLEPFHNWYEPCRNYKDIIAAHPELNLTSEEFKSFPSGHTGTAAILIAISCFLPILVPNIKKKLHYGLIIGSVVYTLIVALTRIIVGAHFLSDIAMGGLLVILFAFIFNELAINVPKLHATLGLEEEIHE